MPKRLYQQRRGRGLPRYLSPSHRYKGKVSFPPVLDQTWKGKIIDILNCPGHSAPLILVKWENRKKSLLIAPVGVKVGEDIEMGPEAEIRPGNIVMVGRIPEGTDVYMIEVRPGDGGKLVRAAGSFAKILSKDERYVYVQLPSREIKPLDPRCRAIIGRIAGGGRLEKPIVKAGKKYHIMRARNRRWPYVAASVRNAVDHPFGGGKERRPNKPRTVSRNAPPGKKVGSFGARRTGLKKK